MREIFSAEERRAVIIEEIAKHHRVEVSTLSRKLGVSEVSIRRDLAFLEERGLLKRVHGGALALPLVRYEQSYREKEQQNIAEKERIGRAAARLIQENGKVILNSGTTVLQVARNISPQILQNGRLTVITNSLPIVRELGRWEGVQIILLGGLYLPNQDILVGPQALSALKGLHVERMFLGTDGLTISHGVTTSSLLEAEVDEAMTKAASEIIVVTDSSKIGCVGLVSIIPLNKIHKLITDQNAPPDFIAALEEMGVEVILV
ncbi:MAG: DeoR/GlpR family DNA-binding transcription regulator [Anaerolineae bacterium]